MKEIIQEGNKILRQKTDSVSNFNTPELSKLIKEMFESLEKESDGVALAAPQIAVSKRIFIVSPKIPGIEKEHTVYINPEIIKQSNDKKKLDEGCLSVRWKYGKTKRSSRVTVSAKNEKGENFIIEGVGLLAQIFQHEIDHLNGILFIDHATNIEDLPPHE